MDPYTTINYLFGKWHAERREWDNRQECYRVTYSHESRNKLTAITEASELAKKEGIEFRP
jgi:hypothetical protein